MALSQIAHKLVTEGPNRPTCHLTAFRSEVQGRLVIMSRHFSCSSGVERRQGDLERSPALHLEDGKPSTQTRHMTVVVALRSEALCRLQRRRHSLAGLQSAQRQR